MTIAATNRRNDYTGNGATDVYAYTFKVFNKNDLKVTKRDTSNVETLLVVDTDYTVSGVGESAGGSITLTAGNLPTDYRLTIRRLRPLTQDTDIRNQGDFFPEVHEDAFDDLVMKDLTQQDEIDRSLKFPETTSGVSPTLPVPVAGGRYFYLNEAGDAVELVEALGTIPNPMSSKGDLLTMDASSTTRLPVGADGYYLVARSAETKGVEWRSPIAYDLRDFLPAGFVTDGSVDYTAEIDDALATIKAAGGGTLLIPEGTFGATKITRRHLVTIKGVHQRKSKLLALASAETGFLQIEAGPVLYSHLEDLAIWGGNGSTTNSGQWAIYSVAAAVTSDGGEWYTNHKNLEIKYFDNGIWYKGGATGSLLPHQFITHENVAFQRTSDTGVSLKLSGQVGQFLDLNGRYDGKTLGQGTNIYIGRDGGTNAPYACNFIGTTSQTAERAFDIDYAWNITIQGGNFEQLYRAIRTGAASAMVNVIGNKFANAGSDGASGGYIIQVGATSNGNFEGNYIYGSFDKAVSNNTGNRGFSAGGNYFGGITDLTIAHTSGCAIQKSVTAGPPVSLDIYAIRDVLVNTSASPITQINSLLMPGELLYLKATGGPITLATGGNIYLGGPSSMVVPQNQTVILRRTDLGSTAWLLHSLSRVHDAVSADNGDAAATLTVATSEITQVWNTPLTVDRAVTLSTTGAYNGAVFHIVRTAAATGAYNLNVGTGPLKALATGTWCEVKYDGSAWMLTAYGTL